MFAVFPPSNEIRQDNPEMMEFKVPDSALDYIAFIFIFIPEQVFSPTHSHLHGPFSSPVHIMWARQAAQSETRFFIQHSL